MAQLILNPRVRGRGAQTIRKFIDNIVWHTDYNVTGRVRSWTDANTYYSVRVDLFAKSFFCSCPCRQEPCKHIEQFLERLAKQFGRAGGSCRGNVYRSTKDEVNLCPWCRRATLRESIYSAHGYATGADRLSCVRCNASGTLSSSGDYTWSRN